MNLSSYLQMPPAPNVAQGPVSPVKPSAAVGMASPVGASLGFDFAKVMAEQMVRFEPHQRQEIAVAAPTQPAERAHRSDVRDDAKDPEKLSARPDNETDPNDSEESVHTDKEDRQAQSGTSRRAKSRSTERASGESDADPLAGVLVQLAALPVKPTVPTDPAAPLPATRTSPDTAATSLAQLPDVSVAPGTPATSTPVNQVALQTIELSPHVRIITDPQRAPNSESLAAFAKSMGLDEPAIQKLLGQAAATGATTTPTGLTATDTTATAASSSASLNLPHPGSTSATGLAALSGSPQAVAAQVMSEAQISVSPTPAPITGSAAAMNANLVAQGTVLPAMSAADLAAIQQIQITVLPAAAVLPTGLPSSLRTSEPGAQAVTDAISLWGEGTPALEIAELAASFGSSEGESSQSAPQGDSHSPGLGFAQTMANAQAAHSSGKTPASATSTSMSEVYDQLSDKLSTEMAARIHKQLSDGEWKMKFGLRPENLGGVEIQLEMKDGKLDAVFRADNPLTRDLLQNSSQRLRDALENFGIQAGLVHIGQDGAHAQQHRQSGQPTSQSQVGDNSPTQVKDDADAASADSTVDRKAHASLLDLYA